MTGRGPCNLTIRCAVAALLLHGSAAIADPYQYDLRSRFIREATPRNAYRNAVALASGSDSRSRWSLTSSTLRLSDP